LPQSTKLNLPGFIYAGGTPEQIMKYVPNLLAGETIGMMSLTEPGGGSDPLGAMKTVAVRDGDIYRINGQKMWASLANETDVGVLVCKTGSSDGAKGVSAFIVEPKKYPGWTAKPIPMMGLSKSFRTNVLFLDDFVVPAENLIGKEGDGFKIAMHAL
jgi:alkylation response protein AidB-like acyl-CoA dehydrogenase